MILASLSPIASVRFKIWWLFFGRAVERDDKMKIKICTQGMCVRCECIFHFLHLKILIISRCAIHLYIFFSDSQCTTTAQCTCESFFFSFHKWHFFEVLVQELVFVQPTERRNAQIDWTIDKNLCIATFRCYSVCLRFDEKTIANSRIKKGSKRPFNKNEIRSISPFVRRYSWAKMCTIRHGRTVCNLLEMQCGFWLDAAAPQLLDYYFVCARALSSTQMSWKE